MDERLVLDFLQSFQRRGISLSIENIKEALSRLENPQNKFPSILIAGTNGKGSVASFIEMILRCAGYRTGLFTSPHLYDVRERIKISGEMISIDEFLKTGLILKDVLKGDNKLKEQTLTYFEALTAIAFKYFAQKNIDIAVVEVGLGGRLDATNILEPILGVITSISYDHMEFLGNTVESIAKEKAGIIKPNTTIICGCDENLFFSAIAPQCRLLNARFYLNKRDFFIQSENGKIRFSWNDKNKIIEDLTISLKGLFQYENVSLAIASAIILNEKGFKIEESHIREGCKKNYWPCRFEILGTNPIILLDAAHNIDGILKLKESINAYFCHFGNKKIITIFGVKEVKRYYEMLEILSSITSVFIFPEVDGLTSKGKLFKIAEKLGKKSFLSSSCRDAFLKAKELTSSNDLILITGSIYLLGNFKFLR